MALKYSPNMILIDLMSTEIDSTNLCGYVRGCEELTDCTLIALAGGLSPNEATGLKSHGFDAVVTEPESINAVLNCIQQNCGIIH